MKKGSFVFAAGLLLLASCNHFKAATGTGGETANTNEKNLENHNAILRGIERGDVKGFDSLMSKDIVDHEANNGRDVVGLDSNKAYLGSLHNYFDHLKIDVLESATSPDGQYFFATVHITGKAKANPWGVPVGTEMDETDVDLIKIKDGKATDHWSFESTKDIMKMKSMSGSDKMAPAKMDSTHKKM